MLYLGSIMFLRRKKYRLVSEQETFLAFQMFPIIARLSKKPKYSPLSKFAYSKINHLRDPKLLFQGFSTVSAVCCTFGSRIRPQDMAILTKNVDPFAKTKYSAYPLWLLSSAIYFFPVRTDQCLSFTEVSMRRNH